MEKILYPLRIATSCPRRSLKRILELDRSGKLIFHKRETGRAHGLPELILISAMSCVEVPRRADLPA